MKLMKEEIPIKIINRIGEDFFRRKVKGDGVFEESYTKHQVINTSNKLKSTAIVEATLTDVLSIFLVISIIHDPGADVFQLSKFSKFYSG